MSTMDIGYRIRIRWPLLFIAAAVLYCVNILYMLYTYSEQRHIYNVGAPVAVFFSLFREENVRFTFPPLACYVRLFCLKLVFE